jgi:8-oxo-dGTP pyrophosphatase MutT (NUDIX family)
VPRERDTRDLAVLHSVAETSAGGLVVDLAADPPRAAVIGRPGRDGTLLWSLPKGHVEPDETIEAAAVREVAEETGITGHVAASLGSIDYWFVAGGRRVHKTVHHFLLIAEGGQLSNADPEVSEVAWVAIGDLGRVLAYEDERGVIAEVPALLAGRA